jgi:hypothetical protein
VGSSLGLPNTSSLNTKPALIREVGGGAGGATLDRSPGRPRLRRLAAPRAPERCGMPAARDAWSEMLVELWHEVTWGGQPSRGDTPRAVLGEGFEQGRRPKSSRRPPYRSPEPSPADPACEGHRATGGAGAEAGGAFGEQCFKMLLRRGEATRTGARVPQEQRGAHRSSTLCPVLAPGLQGASPAAAEQLSDRVALSKPLCI